MKYKVRLHKSEEGYSVSCPGLPGCWSQGDTEEEALNNIRCDIQEYLQAAEELIEKNEIREIEVPVQSCRRFLESIIISISRFKVTFH